MGSKSWDNLSILTKADIIQFLKENPFYAGPPSLYDVEVFKWHREGDRLQKEMGDHLNGTRGKSQKIAVEIDRLSVEFNNEKDLDKKIAIMSAREKQVKKLKAIHAEYARIAKKQDANDRFYEAVQSRRKAKQNAD